MPVVKIKTVVVTKTQKYECYESSTTVQTVEICSVVPDVRHNTVADSEMVGDTPTCNAVLPAPIALSPPSRGNPGGRK